ncbi:MAG: Nif3-like dinuclear metal center hexameric protein [Labilithrix sp.]
MKVADALKTLDELAPLRYAESWDNVGLLVGDPDAEITRALVTVDYSAAVAAEAKERGANLVVAYHPPMFAAVKRVPHDALWADAVRSGIALYSMHTALDVALDGTNDFLARVCGLGNVKPIRPFQAKPGRPEPEGIGLGRIGDVAPAPLGDLVSTIKTKLGLSHVMVAGSLDRSVKRIAVAAGAGGELLSDAIRQKAELFVTGELRHHDAMRGCAIIATLHSNSERAAVREFGGRVASSLAGVEVMLSDRDADPFYFV